MKRAEAAHRCNRLGWIRSLHGPCIKIKRYPQQLSTQQGGFLDIVLSIPGTRLVEDHLGHILKPGNSAQEVVPYPRLRLQNFLFLRLQPVTGCVLIEDVCRDGYTADL